MTNSTIKQGEIYYADLSGSKYSEQGSIRPVLVIQNDVGNKYSPTTIIVPLTTEIKKVNMPTHTVVSKAGTGLKYDSMALCEQVRTIDKRRLKERIGCTNKSTLNNVFSAYMANFTV